MAVTRNDSNYPLPYFGPLSGISAYANRGGEIFHYVSSQTNPYDVLNATYRVHVFDKTGDQSIYFDRAGSVDVLLIAGGGSGGTTYEAGQVGGGGGAGGLLESYSIAVDQGETRITVGRGGTGKESHNGEPYAYRLGGNSSFGSLTAIGGGMGGCRGNVYYATASGGSGGGSSDSQASGGLGVPGQGNNGGSQTASQFDSSAGGGGAGGPGASPQNVNGPERLGHGGPGRAIAFYSNTEYYYCGGGAGGIRSSAYGVPQGGIGGGGMGYANNIDHTGDDATYYGGGGAGAVNDGSDGWIGGGSGYQGLVMVRYRIG